MNPGTKYSTKCSDALWYGRSNARHRRKVPRNSRIGTQVTRIRRITRQIGKFPFFSFVSGRVISWRCRGGRGGGGGGFKFLLSSKRARARAGARRDAKEGCSEKIGREESGPERLACTGVRGGRGGDHARGWTSASAHSKKKNHLHGNSKPGFQSIKGCTHAAAHTEGRNK